MPNEVTTMEGAFLTPEAAIEEVRRGYLDVQLEVGAASMSVAGVAMLAFSMQNIAVLDRSCSFIDSLAEHLPAELEPDDPQRHLALWVRNACHLVREVVRAIQAMQRCDYDAVPQHARQAADCATAARAHWDVLATAEPGLGGEASIAIWIGALEKLPFLAGLVERQSKADRMLLEGDRQSYVDLMEQVQGAVELERRQPQPLNDLFAPILLNLLTAMSESMRARMDFVRRSLQERKVARPAPAGRRVFIIHGHDEGAWRDLRDMLQGDDFGLEAVVLKEQPGATQTLIEKFERAALECAFAIALVTPDDMVRKAGKASWQARPNVLFELGWFYGRLGPQRLLVLKRGDDTVLPSDLGGILTLDFGKSVRETLASLRDELKAAGLLPARP